MRSYQERAAALKLVTSGLSDGKVARLTGIPRETIRDWRRGRVTALSEGSQAYCEVCGGHPERLPAPQYAYLLGQYLGDGHIVFHARGVHRLRVSCCATYLGIVDDVRSAIRSVRPANAVGVAQPWHGVIVVSSYSKHWPCLFPQTGPGRKHTRAITLTEWQQAIANRRPDMLLRGLIHSDGWRGTNRVKVRGRTYQYPRYQFTNSSPDIRQIFCDACDLVGVQWRQMNATNISVARRESVAILDEFIGPKA